MKASLLHHSHCLLGEGAFWHEGRQCFLWVDIDGKRLYETSLITGELRHWQFEHRPSMIAQEMNNRCLLAFQGGIARFDLETEKLEWLIDLEKEIPDNRSNDGGIDCEGRLWIGTMNVRFREGAGTLYCVDHTFSVTKKITGLTIPNGLVWSLDNRTLYHIDSPTRMVRAYDYDRASGEITFNRVAITIPIELGSPDGMCMDDEGMLWIAQWNGFGVYRWNPHDGQLLNKIEVPVPQVSSCAFGGPDYDQLLITTARENFSAEALEKYPDSGSVYIVKPGVRGVRKNLFQA